MIDISCDSPPVVSIIVPVFNRETSIRRAIASVSGQVHGSYEVIVVDDGSTDGTVAAAQAAISEVHGGAGRVICQANAGPGAARNAGARIARGRYLAFLDSDDFWYPQTLRACLDALAGPERPALVFLQTIDLAEGHSVTAGDCGHPNPRLFDGFLEAVLNCPSTRYGSCNAIVRRDVFAALGGFTEEERCSEDTDLFLRAAASGPCLVLADVPLVGHVSGSGDRLTGSFPAVLSGYRFMLAREAAGAYPDRHGRGRRRDGVLGRCAVHTALAAFSAGRPGTAYAIYLRSLPRLLRAGMWHWLIRVPLVPLLAVLRPASYDMRWVAAS